MSSGVALRGSEPIHVYTAAKGGIIAFTQALAGTYAKNNIRANAICPGVIMTDRVSSLDSQTEEYPFSVGEPEDIARIALFLASAESRMLTGVSIPGDGGLSAH